jgi:hypothetical protein
MRLRARERWAGKETQSACAAALREAEALGRGGGITTTSERLCARKRENARKQIAGAWTSRPEHKRAR